MDSLSDTLAHMTLEDEPETWVPFAVYDHDDITPHPRKGSMTSADLAKSRHRTSDDPPRGRSRSTSGDLPNPYWNLRSPPTNLPRRGRGPSTDLADLRAQISSISNPPVSIDDTADCNLELRVGMSVT